MWKLSGIGVGYDEIYTTGLFHTYFFYPIMNHNRVD